MPFAPKWEQQEKRDRIMLLIVSPFCPVLSCWTLMICTLSYMQSVMILLCYRFSGSCILYFPIAVLCNSDYLIIKLQCMLIIFNLIATLVIFSHCYIFDTPCRSSVSYVFTCPLQYFYGAWRRRDQKNRELKSRAIVRSVKRKPASKLK
jgi:hypothetical protein